MTIILNPHYRSVACLALWFCLALILGALTAPEALAHASLIRSEPADRSVVAAAPTHIHLKYNEPVSALVLKLVAADGSATTLDKFVLADTTLTVTLPDRLADGTYVLSWRVISEDGHPVSGSVLFSIGAPSAGAIPAVDTAPDPVLRAAIWAAKVALYLGLFLGVGGAVFHGIVAMVPAGVRRFALSLIAVGLAAAALSAGLQGLDALDLPISAIAQPRPWSEGLATSFGRTVILAILSCCLGIVALGAERPVVRRASSIMALLGVGIALAASGHASAASPGIVTRPAVFVHGVGITFWAGSLVPLGVLLLSGGSETATVLRRYGAAILPVFIALAIAGIALSLIQLDHLSALWTTAYGEVFSVKVTLVVGLLALAAFNRFRLTPAYGRGAEGAGRSFARSIAVEMVLVLAIFAVAALWRFTPPPRALAAMEALAVPASVHLHGEKAMADVAFMPGRAGPVTATIELMDGEANALQVQEVTLALSNPAAGIEPLRRSATRSADGTWQIQDLTIPVAGRWTVRVDALISNFDKAVLEEPIDIP
jgi:copper transport protein